MAERCGTIIGYDVVSGERLITETNRVTRFPDGTNALPHKNRLYVVNDKAYLVVGVRKDSTETLWKIDVREEPRGGISHANPRPTE